MAQVAMWCSCGKTPVNRRGLCQSCERRRRLSAEAFGGLREQVLLRDEGRCQCCGEYEAAQVIVHHRSRSAQSARRLITLCRACHAKVHRTHRPGFGFPDELRTLWREAHHGLAEQRDFSFEEVVRSVARQLALEE